MKRKWIVTLLKQFKSNEGSVLAFIVIMLMVISILLASVLFVFNNNLVQAKGQETNMEAYYLAYSGVEMGYSALLANGNAKMTELTRTTSPVASQTQNDVAFGNGVIDIIAVKTADAGFENWIKVTSTATLNGSSKTYTRIMYFDPADPSKKVWSDN